MSGKDICYITLARLWMFTNLCKSYGSCGICFRHIARLSNKSSFVLLGRWELVHTDRCWSHWRWMEWLNYSQLWML